MAKYTIGRDDSNDITLADGTISRKHAEIEDAGGGEYVLRDLDSSYGTKVERGGEWVDALEVTVTADTEVVLGELKTTIGALLQQAAGPKTQAPAQAAAAAAQAPAVNKGGGTGLDKATKMWLMIGGGGLVLLVIIAVVVALMIGDGSGVRHTRTDNGSGTTTGKTNPGTTPNPGNRGSTSSGNTRRFVNACIALGRGTESQCRCMGNVAAQELSPEEVRLFAMLLEASKDKSKQSALIRYASQIQKLTAKLGQIGRKFAAQCRRG
jgi:FHA domain